MSIGNLVVRRGRLHTSRGFLEDGSVVVAEGRIVFVGPDSQVPKKITAPSSGRTIGTEDMPVLNAQGCVISPGFVEVHMHGGGGREVMDASLESLRTMAQAHARHGTTAFLAGSVTAPQAALEAVAEAIKEATGASKSPDWNGARVLGLHLEGPYLSDEKRGAQNPAYLRSPSREEIERIIDILGADLRHITLAPELPGALEIIPWLRERNIRVALGHSAADYDTAMKAIAAGADHATHTYNGMVSLHHREPGVLGAVLSHDAVTAELIADGVHVHPGALRVVWKAKGTAHTCLVTDAGMAMDMPDGRYMLGELPVEVKDGVCRLVDGGALASSVLGLDVAVKNMVELVGVPLEEAIMMASAVPARQLGMSASKGSLEVGKDGDICLLGPDLLCQATVVAGRRLLL